jgi:hypothetical protein
MATISVKDLIAVLALANVITRVITSERLLDIDLDIESAIVIDCKSFFPAILAIVSAKEITSEKVLPVVRAIVPTNVITSDRLFEIDRVIVSVIVKTSDKFLGNTDTMLKLATKVKTSENALVIDLVNVETIVTVSVLEELSICGEL